MLEVEAGCANYRPLDEVLFKPLGEDMHAIRTQRHRCFPHDEIDAHWRTKHMDAPIRNQVVDVCAARRRRRWRIAHHADEPVDRRREAAGVNLEQRQVSDALEEERGNLAKKRLQEARM